MNIVFPNLKQKIQWLGGLLQNPSVTLTQAATIIGFFTLVTKLISIVKVNVIARTFAAGDVSDVYFAAFRLPDLLVNFLILGTLSVALIPVLSQALTQDKEKAERLVSTVFAVAMGGMTIMCLIAFIFIEPLTAKIFPGFTGEKLVETIKLSRILMLSPLIFTASSIFTSILTVYKRFVVASIAPTLYNLGIIFGVIFLYPKLGLIGVGLGVLTGALLHASVQLIAIWGLSFRPRALLPASDQQLTKVRNLFIPRLFAFDATQASLFIGSIFASLLVSGSLSVFNYAYDLQSVPIGIFALSTAAAAFPILSEFAAKEKFQEFIQTLFTALTQIAYFIIPISIAFLVFRAHMVRLLLGHGRFGWEETISTFELLGLLSLSLIAQAVIPLLARGFYALHDTKTPMFISLSALVVNIGVTFYASKPEHFGILGIGIGFISSVTLQTIVLFLLLRRNLQKRSEEVKQAIAIWDEQLVEDFLKITLASSLAGLLSYISLYLVEGLVNTRTTLGLAIQTAISGGIGFALYLGIGKMFGLQQATRLLRILRFKTSKIDSTVETSSKS